MTSEWIYDGKPLDGTEQFIQDFRAFVYVIRNKTSEKRYYGKKRLHFTSHRKRANRKNRIKVVKDSDWRSYWGSSDNLKRDIEELGSDCFDREILRFCRTLSESNYYELKHQMDNDVLLYPDKFYNSYIGTRVSRKQLGIKE